MSKEGRGERGAVEKKTKEKITLRKPSSKANRSIRTIEDENFPRLSSLQTSSCVPFFRRRNAPSQVVAPGGGDAEGLLPSRSQPAAFAHEFERRSAAGSRPQPRPSREHHHPTPLTPRRASAMLRGAASAAAAPTRQAITTVLSSWVSRRFLGGLAVILPIAMSRSSRRPRFLNFFDRLFAPLLEALLGFRVVGLGFATSMLFILATGVVASSYVGGALISLGSGSSVGCPW